MNIGIIGDYDQNRPSHVATHEALQHTATFLSKKISIQWIPTKPLDNHDNLNPLNNFDCVWGAPGDPESSLGFINAIQFIREKSIPYLGTWSGFQHALVEYAANALRLEQTETSIVIPDLFSTLITKMSCSLVGETQKIFIRKKSLAHKIYHADQIMEMFNCSYSLNEDYRTKFEESNLNCVGNNQDGDARIIEIPEHKFFLAMLFQPQLSSNESSPHPVIVSFLKAANI